MVVVPGVYCVHLLAHFEFIDVLVAFGKAKDVGVDRGHGIANGQPVAAVIVPRDAFEVLKI